VLLLKHSPHVRQRVARAVRARSEQSLSAGKDLVQRILKMRRRFRKILPHLIDVFLVALLDLFAKQLLERAITQPFIAPLRKVRHQIGDERA
jgi:hypothetical protein